MAISEAGVDATVLPDEQQPIAETPEDHENSLDADCAAVDAGGVRAPATEPVMVDELVRLGIA